MRAADGNVEPPLERLFRARIVRPPAEPIPLKKKVGLGVPADIAFIALCVMVPEFLGPLFLGHLNEALKLLKEYAGRLALAVVVLLSLGIRMLLPGAIQPYQEGNGAIVPLTESFDKLELLGMVALAAIPFYAVIGTDALQRFC